MAYTPENNPYIPGDPYSYDLKWVVSNIKDLIANYTGQIDELKAFIMDYINSLDLSPIVAAELQEMYDNGDFDALIASFITDNKVLLVDTDQSAIFTEAEKETGRKNLRAGGTNPNLLDNPWFFVNQREASTGLSSASAYVADRWLTIFGNATGVVNHINAGIEITPGASSWQGIRQRLDNVDFLNGKQITVSFMLSNGNIYSDTITRIAGTEQVIFNSTDLLMVIVINASNDLIIRVFSGAQTVIIRAVKLEIGPYSTLANDAPPDYAEELTKCHFYDNQITARLNAIIIGIGFASTATNLVVMIKDELRDAARTITMSGAITATDKTNTSVISAISVAGYGSGYTLLDCTTTGLTAGKTYGLQLAQDAFINLSADL